MLSLSQIDSLLEPLLLTAAGEADGELLSQLIATHAEPVIRGIIRYKLHLNSPQAIGQADANDIYQEVIVQLLTALQQFRERPDAHPIGDLRGLAAVIAHRACSRWMRRQFPERHAFKNRLYYLLTRQRGIAVWRDEGNKSIAGFDVWQGKMKAVNDERLRHLSNDEALLACIWSVRTGGSAEWSSALAEVFNFLGGPVEFDQLVHTLAECLQIRDQPVESVEQIEDTGDVEVAAGQGDTAWQVEKRIFLQRLWEEVRQLPLNQRLALLLNLRDADGRGCIALFPATGIASFRQLAEALEMSAEKLAEIWNELPLEDAGIAELLQLTRQQIINARKSARERLARRLKGFI